MTSLDDISLAPFTFSFALITMLFLSNVSLVSHFFILRSNKFNTEIEFSGLLLDIQRSWAIATIWPFPSSAAAMNTSSSVLPVRIGSAFSPKTINLPAPFSKGKILIPLRIIFVDSLNCLPLVITLKSTAADSCLKMEQGLINLAYMAVLLSAAYIPKSPGLIIKLMLSVLNALLGVILSALWNYICIVL